MPDFRENGVIWCARLESKKSASGAVKKIRAAEWSRKMSRGGLIQPPPPPAVLGLNCCYGGLTVPLLEAFVYCRSCDGTQPCMSFFVCLFVFLYAQPNWPKEVQVQSTLPKSNPLGLRKWLWLRENSTYVGSKTIANKDKRIWIDLWLRRLFDLCEFDLGRVDYSTNWNQP